MRMSWCEGCHCSAVAVDSIIYEYVIQRKIPVQRQMLPSKRASMSSAEIESEPESLHSTTTARRSNRCMKVIRQQSISVVGVSTAQKMKAVWRARVVRAAQMMQAAEGMKATNSTSSSQDGSATRHNAKGGSEGGSP